MGTLYVVATPIGNLEDMTLRAARVLRQVPLVAAEDTRRTRELLSHLDAHPRLISFHEHSTQRRIEDLLGYLNAGDVALVTDAGTPGVSDPGPQLVAASRLAGHDIVPVPGPSAVATALSISGLPADAYVFVGFLPRKGRERRAVLAGLASETRTLVAFETPQRLVAALEDVAATFGAGRTIVVARELTKRFEEVWHGTVEAAIAHWRASLPRGEFTLVIAGSDAGDADVAPWDDEAVRAALADLKGQGKSAREASRQVAAEAARPAREVYRLWEHGTAVVVAND